MKNPVASILALAASLALIGSAHGGTCTWQGRDSLAYWSSPASWLCDNFWARVPEFGDVVDLGSTFAVRQNMTAVLNLPAGYLSRLTIDLPYNVPNLSMTLLQQAGSDLSATIESIGVTSRANAHVQSGGSNTVDWLYLGGPVHSQGSYSLSDSAVLKVSNFLVGDAGAGVVNQSGGAVTVSQKLAVGRNTGFGDSSTYRLSGGTLAMGQGANLSIGDLLSAAQSGNGSFDHSGGTLSFAERAGLSLYGSNDSTVTNRYVLSGSGEIVDAAFEWIGGSFGGKAATFSQTGGSNRLRAGARLTVGDFGDGAYELSGGILDAPEIVLGGAFSGNGTFSQSGGSNNALTLQIGSPAGGAGSYTLSAGSLTVGTLSSAGSFVVGSTGSGAFNQSGGVVVVQGLGSQLAIGTAGSGPASYILSAGQLDATTLALGGSGRFVQGGVGADSPVASVGQLTVAGSGRYELSGGVLSVGDAASIAAGGRFSQSGGTFYGVLDNDGDVLLSGGNFAGSLNHHGGTATLSGGVLSGRLINNARLVQNAGDISGWMINNGDFSHAGGSISGALTNGVDGTLSFTGPLLVGGALENLGSIRLTTGNSLGGSTFSNDGSIVLAGGSLTGGSIINSGSLSGWGRFVGGSGLQNAGQVIQSGGNLQFANTGTNTNFGTFALQAGRVLQLDIGSTLDNAGSLQLNGALVSGAGQLVNGVGGTLEGKGTVSASLLNHGDIVPGAGTLNVTRSWTNDGVVQLTGPLSTIAGARLVNAGTVQGQGTLAAPVVNTGTLEAIGGTLVFGSAVSNPSGGILAASSDAQLLARAGLSGNAGTIALSGGTFDNGGKSLDNTGRITGWGLVRSGGIRNSGQILLAGADTSLYSDVLALGGSRTAVSGNSSATFYGTVDVQDGAELRIAAGSMATFYGDVFQRTGALFTGGGTKHYEGRFGPGASPGLGTDAGSVVLGDLSQYLAEIGGKDACTLACATDDALRNAGFDHFAVAGKLAFGGTLVLTSWKNFVAQAGDRFDLFDWGTTSGHFTAIDSHQFALAAGTALDTTRLYVDGSIGVIAVPEPAAWALMAGGLMLLSAVARTAQRREAAA